MRRATALLDPLHRVDHLLFVAVHRGLGLRPLVSFLSLVSRLGNGSIYLGILFYLVARGGSYAVLHSSATALLGLALYKLLKQLVGRPRPCEVILELVPAVPPIDRWSFPSGHTLHAVSFCVLLASWAPELLPLALPFAALTGLSRVVLGLHYPFDVAAGGLLGYAIAEGMLKLFGPA
ncbi:MAG: phosphatase PAP2 family protein [Planctomycetes bacterium]|nr:phosphatase PAP2 family protein [Planctomycetota bacterium]